MGAFTQGGMAFGQGVGRGIRDYRDRKEKRELLSGEAHAIYNELYSREEAGGKPLGKGEEEMLKKLENVGDMGTRELQGIISEYETGEKMDNLRLRKKIQQFQLNKLQFEEEQRGITRDRDAAVSGVYENYLKQSSAPSTDEVAVPAVYDDVRTPVGSVNDIMLPNEFSELPPEKPTYQERLPEFADKQRVVSQIDDLIGRKESAISDFKEQAKTLPHNQDSKSARLRYLMYKGEGYKTSEEKEAGYQKMLEENPVMPEHLRDGISRLEDQISDLEYDRDSYIEGGSLTRETIDRLPPEYRNSLDPLLVEGSKAELLSGTQGEPITLTDRRLVSEATTKTVERPKTAEEKEAILQEQIAEKASVLGAKGIKEIKELVKNSDLQIVELQGTHYVFSPKSGSFQVIPKDKKTAADAANQIAILGRLGLRPEAATVELGGGTTVKLTVPSPENGGPKTESQAKAFLHAGSMKLTGAVIDEMTDQGFDAARIDNAFELYHNQNAIKSPEAKRYAAAMNKWLEAYLRHVSGAAIAKHEYEGARQQFFPVVNDGQDALDDKKRLRDRMFSLMEQVSGGKVSDEGLKNKAGSYELKAGETLSLVSDTESEARDEAERRGLKSGDKYIWIDTNSGMQYTYTVD